MSDRGLPGMLHHQSFVAIFVVHAEHFRNATDVLMCLNQLQTFRVIAGDSRCQLSSVLHVQQHPGNKSRCSISDNHRIFR